MPPTPRNMTKIISSLYFQCSVEQLLQSSYDSCAQVSCKSQVKRKLEKVLHSSSIAFFFLPISLVKKMRQSTLHCHQLCSYMSMFLTISSSPKAQQYFGPTTIDVNKNHIQTHPCSGQNGYLRTETFLFDILSILQGSKWVHIFWMFLLSLEKQTADQF